MKKLENLKVNDFFYKYFNDQFKDESILEFVDDNMYLYVFENIIRYDNEKNQKISYDKFTYNLSKLVILQFKKEVEQLNKQNK